MELNDSEVKGKRIKVSHANPQKECFKCGILGHFAR